MQRISVGGKANWITNGNFLQISIHNLKILQNLQEILCTYFMHYLIGMIPNQIILLLIAKQ